MVARQNPIHVGYLEYLLQYLACPIDGTSALTIIRNHDDQVGFLRSQNGEYPVINNIPCMLPAMGYKKNPAWERWESLLGKWMEAFGSQSESEPSSENDPVAGYIGEVIGRSGVELCLDVGCGFTVWTPYMDACGEEVKWIGIDPVLGDLTRHYPFVQGLGEYLPFRSGVFDGILFSLVLSNMLDPKRSMRQAHRVLKSGGKIYIRYYATRLVNRCPDAGNEFLMVGCRV
jgi:SAM-dependent methyltransferase